MLKLKKSGWAGKAKVALVLSSVVVFSLIIAQCNSQLNDQADLDEGRPIVNNSLKKIDLPVLPASGENFDVDLAKALHLSISDNKLYLNDNQIEIDQLQELVKEESEEGTVIATSIDKNQSMEFVRKVFLQLRIANRRKMVFLAKTNSGYRVNVRMLLPPAVNDPSTETNSPTLTEEFIKENNIELLKIDLGDNSGAAILTKVYDFVTYEISQGNSNYVVSARYGNNDSYQNYLENLRYIQEGFYKIYNERAIRMFGKSFSEINSASDPESKEAYQAIRKGVPMAISVAEN